MENYRQLFESMFNKNLADEDARDFLYRITQEYPFFSPGQFLLLQKTDKTSADYKKQLLKTAVAFNNNYWLNYLLLQQDKDAFIESFSALETIADTPAEQTTYSLPDPVEQQLTGDEITNTPAEEIVAFEEPTHIELEGIEHSKETNVPVEELSPAAIQDDVEPADVAISSFDEAVQVPEHLVIKEESDISLPEAEEPLLKEIDKAVEAGEDTKEEIQNGLVQEDVIVDEISEALADRPVTIEEIESVEKSEEINETTPGESATIEPTSFEEESAGETIENTIIEVSNPDQKQADETIEHAVIEASNTEQKRADETFEHAVNEMAAADDGENFVAPLKTDLAEAAAILDTKPVENGPLFEPLHTTDYFASVGIKLSDEIKPGDKLGTQLKSFTEWLKTMKKLHSGQGPALQETTEKQNNNIQQLAEKSNKEDEIITEAMADVLMQQGRIEKAVEVLKKLSLLNPSKNTYFAAKIDKLKEE